MLFIECGLWFEEAVKIDTPDGEGGKELGGISS